MTKAILPIINWFTKKLIILHYKIEPEWLATSISYNDEHIDFTILVNHYYSDHENIGTKEIWYD